MIKKLTEREFDSEFNEYDKWPMDLSYKVYSRIMDDINEALTAKVEVERNEVNEED